MGVFPEKNRSFLNRAALRTEQALWRNDTYRTVHALGVGLADLADNKVE